MPENAEGEPPRRILDRLERSVLGPGRPGETLPQPAEALVVVALHRRAVAEDSLHSAAGFQLDVVIAEDARRVLVLLVTDDVRQVLNEIAAESDVQDLAAAADREHGHVPPERRLEEHELRAVTIRKDTRRLFVRLLPVQLGVEVGAPGEDEAVDRIERLLHAVVARWNKQCAPACALDGPDVRGRNERRFDVPGPEAGGDQVRRDADDRAGHPRSNIRSRS